MSTTIVKEIGALVPTFKEDKIVILFGPQAPEEIKEMSIIHEFEHHSEEPLQEGGTIEFDNQVYTITAVGTKANENLRELGHISIYFHSPPEDILPGSVFVSPHNFPDFNEGTLIKFKS
ncbi:PTS glucitol/sorbitol transporter subunit IIA [Alkalihalobacillus sp. TS-13]|uniref:PTS glucitol/sorbitol transporter subunit IIA n=1 Tax=Alkalihalobacillus sp. TS-13 TaxID=2842455 RepID=UPI001C870D1F|nr:PTS glucitol/sorbitol transporter subunit IIA [Alkalihalobacillus sp. TS-13]